LHLQRVTSLILLSSSLLAFAAAGPAAALTITDFRGSTLTLDNQGRIIFVCEHGAIDPGGSDSYRICTAGGDATGGSGQFVRILSVSNPTVTPPSSFVGPLAFNQVITLESLTYALGTSLGIHTFVTWRGGTCDYSVTVKLFNRSGSEIRIKEYKRILDVMLGTSTADDQFAGGATSLTALASDPSGTIVLSGGGNSGATTARAYSSFAGTDQGTCGFGSDATRDARTGNRDLAVRYEFMPGWVGLKPAGQSGSEKFFSVRYTVQ
jgi:hypothetical protein